MAASLEIVVRCTKCGFEVDSWELGEDDPATHVCEIAGDLDFRHTCATDKAEVDALKKEKGGSV